VLSFSDFLTSLAKNNYLIAVWSRPRPVAGSQGRTPSEDPPEDDGQEESGEEESGPGEYHPLAACFCLCFARPGERWRAGRV
jgi:hypothetical protein